MLSAAFAGLRSLSDVLLIDMVSVAYVLVRDCPFAVQNSIAPGNPFSPIALSKVLRSASKVLATIESPFSLGV